MGPSAGIGAASPSPSSDGSQLIPPLVYLLPTTGKRFLSPAGLTWRPSPGNMVFSYYQRLSPVQRKIYDQSDRVRAVRLYRPSELHPLVGRLQTALESGRRPRVERASRELLRAVTARLGVPPVRLEVLTVRPHNHRMELHGFYAPGRGRKWPVVAVWMRTAKRQRIVAFRTFLRTLIHELCHHLDYAYLGLPDSYHTEGFYRRETSLFKQLVPGSRPSEG